MSVKPISTGQEQFVSISHHLTPLWLPQQCVNRDPKGCGRKYDHGGTAPSSHSMASSLGQTGPAIQGQPISPFSSMSFLHIAQLRNNQCQLILRKRGEKREMQGISRPILTFPTSINEWVKDLLSWKPSLKATFYSLFSSLDLPTSFCFSLSCHYQALTPTTSLKFPQIKNYSFI